MRSLLIILLVFQFSLSGCSTMGKNERLRWNITGAGILAGAAGGAAFAPKDEKREVHALNWAGIIGLLAAGYAMFFHNDRKRLKKLENENYTLKNEPEFEILDEFNARLKKPLFRGGPTEGNWQYQKIDTWLKVNDDQLIHQNRRFIRTDKKKDQK